MCPMMNGMVGSRVNSPCGLEPTAITAIITGALAVVFGGDVFWSLIALLLGQLIGGAVMALHAAQGPQLGLPQ